MSAGRPRHTVTDDHLRELARIESRPWFIHGKKILKILDRTHDTPWLGGSSTDLKHIYVDPLFRGNAQYLGRPFPVRRLLPPLIEHEEVEGILLVFGTDASGNAYRYDGAHEIATAAEIRKARRLMASLGLPWNEAAYQDIFKPFLKMTERPPWPNIATDLNTECYREDDPALYREIERAILNASIRKAS
jgi:hypothetical protein